MGDFESIDLECSRRAWGLAYALLQNAADADDVMQLAMVVAWRRQAQIPAETWPWFAAVVANCARNFRRGESRKRARESLLQKTVQSTAGCQGAASSIETDELRALLLQALAKLPPEEREAVALCHVGGLTQAQASQTTGVNLNTFKARASRGLARLRETLQSRPGSVEAYLTSMAIPLPAEGVEAALARWRQGAVGAATPGLTLTSLPAIAALAAAMVALLAVLWLALDAGGLQAEANPRAPQIAVENTLPVAGTPPEAAKVPTVVQDGKLGADSEVGGVVGRDSTDASATIDTAEDTPQSAATRPADTLNPPGALAPGSLRVRTSFYESGERYMQWTELVQTTGAIRVGSFAAYFPSGRVQEVGQYVHDKKEGTWTKYHENGAMFYRGDYLDGRPEGPWIFHSAEDRPATEGSYKNGKREGLWRMFHDNGQIERNITYQDDQAEGQSIEFDDQGRKRRETQWHEGARVSQREFDENGNLVE